MGFGGDEAVLREGGIQIWCALLWFLGVVALVCVCFGCTWLSLVHVLLGQDLVPLVSGMCGAGGSRAGCDGS